MTKPWLKNYPADAAEEIELARYDSILDLFKSTVEQYKDKTAFSNFGAELSFSDIDCLSGHFAAYLQQQLNVVKGDRVALMCPNTLCFPVAMWGIIRAGGVQVNVNPQYTARELQHQLQDAQVDTIVIFTPSTTSLADIVEQTSIKNIICINLDDLINKGLPSAPTAPQLKETIAFTTALEEGSTMQLTEPKLTKEDLLFLQYTGGTTGLSKGAMLSHGNIIANVMQYHEFTKNNVKQGEEVVLTAIPMYHIFALTVNTLCYFFYGARNELVTNPRDMPAFVEIWKKTKITFFTGVNTLFNGLLHTPGFNDVDFSHLKITIGGGASVQQAVAKKWLEVTGNSLSEGYGLSETSPVLTFNLANSHSATSGIGIPMPSTDISIRDDEGNILPQGQAGELCAQGPQVMPGYWNNIAATNDVMTSDGYFKTGDIAILDEQGFYHIVDRKKDMIIVSGFNVYPNEIEAEIAKMPGVLESGCIGVADEKTGEAVKVFIVLEDNDITKEDVIDFCRQNLTAYKVPKSISFIDTLPKSGVGKLLRRELR